MACGLVVADLDVEGVEHLALYREWSVAERAGQVGDAVESLGQNLVLGVLCLGGREIRQCRGQGVVVVAQLLDASRDQAGLDPVLERVHLELEAAVGVGELLPDLRRPEVAVAPALATVVAQPLAQAFDPHRAEDPLSEEALDELQQVVLAEVDPLLAGVGLDRSIVAVGAAVGAGVVVVALAGLAVHRERLVSCAAAHATREQVRRAAALAWAALAGGEPVLRAHTSSS